MSKAIKLEDYSKILKGICGNRTIKIFNSGMDVKVGEIVVHESNDRVTFYEIIKNGTLQIPNTEYCIKVELSDENTTKIKKIEPIIFDNNKAMIPLTINRANFFSRIIFLPCNRNDDIIFDSDGIERENSNLRAIQMIGYGNKNEYSPSIEKTGKYSSLLFSKYNDYMLDLNYNKNFNFDELQGSDPSEKIKNLISTYKFKYIYTFMPYYYTSYIDKVILEKCKYSRGYAEANKKLPSNWDTNNGIKIGELVYCRFNNGIVILQMTNGHEYNQRNLSSFSGIAHDFIFGTTNYQDVVIYLFFKGLNFYAVS